jgi:pimeloyl-ACP methyl ester carboxylesterase
MTHHRSVTVGDVDVFFRESGPVDAPVVVLLHGFPTSSRMYRDLIPLLAERYRVLAPDLPGFGSTSRPPRARRTYDFATATDVVDGWLTALGVDRFALYLMDIGGSVGWRLALRRPGQVTALVLQNAPLHSEDGGDFGLLPRYWKERTAEARAAALEQATSLEWTRRQYVVGVPDPTLLDPDAWLLDQAQLERPEVADIVTDYLFDISRQAEVFAAARDWLRTTRPPTLVVTGRNDVIFPESSQRAFLEEVPDAAFHALDTGHFATATHTLEIAALMLPFLDAAGLREA